MEFKSDDYGGGCNTFGQLYNKYPCTIRDLCFHHCLDKIWNYLVYSYY